MSNIARPRVYLAVAGRWGSDLICVLLDPQTMEQLASHICSNETFMRGDLIDRRQKIVSLLNERYPDGYDVIQIPEGEDIPEATT